MALYQEPHQIPRRGPSDLTFLRLNKTPKGHRGPPLSGMIREWPSGACNQTPVCNDPRDPLQKGYMMQFRTSSPFLGIGTRPRDRPGSGLRYRNPCHPGQSHSPVQREPASSPGVALAGNFSVDSSASMRMPNPLCYGRKTAGGPLGPI